MAVLDERVELGYLLDFYGPLLTKRRQELLALYCEEDLTLSEIADSTGITRQGVSDALVNARRQLIEYEEKLGLVARYRAITETAEECLQALNEPRAEGAIERAREGLKTILNLER